MFLKKVIKNFNLRMHIADIFSDNPEYVILEVNSNPGLTMHHYPAIGTPVNVAQYVLDIMFPNWF